jgi:hypothetical protein
MQEALGISKYHNLTRIVNDTCIDIIKHEFNIEGDIIIVKSEEKVFKGASTIVSVNVDYYNPSNKQKLDKSKCKTDSSQVKLPMQVSEKEKQQYIKLQEQGIDMFNKHDPAFRTACKAYSDPDTGYDTTLSYRLENLRSNRTDCLNIGCSYKSFDVDLASINCDCDGTTSDQDNNQDTADTSSSTVLGCTAQIDVIKCI